MTLFTFIEILGTLAFAISGIRLASAKRFDWFGAYVVGFTTAIGGGTLRDLMLSVTPFWMLNSSYLIVTAFALGIVVLGGRHLIHLNNTFFIFDAIGLGLFTVVGVEKTLTAGFPLWVAIIMGTITGAAGGVLRDYPHQRGAAHLPQGDLRPGLRLRRAGLRRRCRPGPLRGDAPDRYGRERHCRAGCCRTLRAAPSDPQAGSRRVGTPTRKEKRPANRCRTLFPYVETVYFRSLEVEFEQLLGGNERGNLVVEHALLVFGDLSLDGRVVVSFRAAPR